MIDKLLFKFWERNLTSAAAEYPPDSVVWQKFRESRPKALTAIYEIGLTVIGADEEAETTTWDCPCGATHTNRTDPSKTNRLKASQRKAWAKACGVDNG